MLKKLLDHKGLNYTYVDDTSILLGLGLTHLPVLEVNGTKMQASQARRWVEEQ